MPLENSDSAEAVHRGYGETKPENKDEGKASRGAELSDAAKQEESVLAFWQENGIFEKSLQKEAPNGEFVFYDGPPFATGLPHSGSLLSSISKDLIPRYKTMRGFRVRRRWGWDTHGLPIESLVEKKLGLKNKKEILSLGIEKFNESARSMVLEYVHDWKRYVDRVGRWVDFDNSYKTMDATFMESVWWYLKQMNEKGLLYEGRKVLMYCPHCETPLAKAEIAMDNTYKDVTEETVTVKFKVMDPAAHGLPEDTFILAWTTTPWTLPGNVALAVGKDIRYGLYEKNGERVVLAKELAKKNNLTPESAPCIRDVSASELVGLSYEPLYEVQKVVQTEGKKWQVLEADFVTAEDGTGIVHTAVIYGEDDYALGLKEGLPMVPILNSNGTYNDDAPEFLHGKYFKKGEADIKADLESRGLLYAREMHTHSYPHCYRCGTALIYNAVSSWFIAIQKIKERLIAENEKNNWIPDHLKHGRFQHILDTAPDWTISRNRFWATPLPFWKDSAGTVSVIGSVEELKAHTKKSGNTYYAMRHGMAEKNVLGIYNTHPENAGMYHLVEQGQKDVRAHAESLKPLQFDRIIVSPFLRTIETAQIVADVLGFPKEKIEIDERLTEVNVGVYEGKKYAEYHAMFKDLQERFTKAAEGAENFNEVRVRIGQFLYELEEKYQNEKILIISHGDPLWLLKLIAKGCVAEEVETIPYPEKGMVEKLEFIPMPHNALYELDLHLPYIDRVALFDEKGEPLTRVPEVVDCWVESGSMPFAEYHYPFENREEFEKRTPGDFVSEYIGQTRAWFYYMHAVSVSLFDHVAFKNVITTGNILAADGEKVSKSKQNYTDPYILFERYSADAFRYYLMASVLLQAEDLAFRDDDVKEIQNRVVNMLRNVLAFYDLFKDEITLEDSEKQEADARTQKNVLDTWIVSRLNEVIQNATDAFDAYDVPRAVRPMREFIEDLSTWYVRRSRDRVKGADEEDKQAALSTLRFVLHEFSKCIAPVMPFIAEDLYQATKRSGGLENVQVAESVHLCDWPAGGKVDAELHASMEAARTIASEGLMLRQKAGIKVRQPLASLAVPSDVLALLGKNDDSAALHALIAEEINVKEIVPAPSAEMHLTTALSPELIREGDVREFMRSLADARKEKGFTQKDLISLLVSENAQELLAGASLPGISEIHFGRIESDSVRVVLSSGEVLFSFNAP
jgi:isoleucyl-tRNA synthetase